MTTFPDARETSDAFNRNFFQKSEMAAILILSQDKSLINEL
jgi:hypothetical protein